MELDMSECLTIQLALLNVFGCLVERPECPCAHKFGFSVVCRHSDNTKYDVHATGILTKNEALELYDILRQKRRDEFTASLEETNREMFCMKTDFFGQPVTNTNLNVFE